MTGLQEAFYIVGLVYMGLSLLLVLGVVVALLVIRKKVVSIEKMIQEKVDLVSSFPARAGELVETVKKMTGRGK